MAYLVGVDDIRAGLKASNVLTLHRELHSVQLHAQYKIHVAFVLEVSWVKERGTWLNQRTVEVLQESPLVSGNLLQPADLFLCG